MKILDSGVIYRNPMPHVKSRHAYFPSVCKLKNGRLVATFSIGEAFESVDLHSFYSISDDNGVTWTPPKEICAKTQVGRIFAEFQQIKKGKF